MTAVIARFVDDVRVHLHDLLAAGGGLDPILDALAEISCARRFFRSPLVAAPLCSRHASGRIDKRTASPGTGVQSGIGHAPDHRPAGGVHHA